MPLTSETGCVQLNVYIYFIFLGNVIIILCFVVCVPHQHLESFEVFLSKFSQNAKIFWKFLPETTNFMAGDSATNKVSLDIRMKGILHKLNSCRQVFRIFKGSALWADAFYKSKCPYVCVFVCVSVCLLIFEVLFKRLFPPTS